MSIPWNTEVLETAPAWSPAPEFTEDGMRALFFEGQPWRGQPTRVFAWYGVPEKQDGPLPAMVLVHGGGGTAFAEWVRLWTGRGYAALAMDTCGCVPVGSYGNWQRHAAGGPPGSGGFDQVDEPAADHWTFHAVSAVIRAHSLLRSFPEIDPARIGLTGISWGGYLTCIIAGLDARFRFAVPVYGCGFLGEDSVWLPDFEKMGAERAALWLSRWDPAVYLPGAALPMLWVTGTNDFAYPIGSLQKSYRLPSGPRHLAIRVNMPHGHGDAGEGPKEIHAFADSLLRNGVPLTQVTGQGRTGSDAWASFTSTAPIERAELHFTRDSGPWQPRAWETVEAYLDTVHGTAHAAVPADALAWYFNLTDARGLAASSEHETRDAGV